MNALKEINANANLLEILREKIEQHDPNAKVETESIIQGRLKTSLSVLRSNEERYAVEILENETANFTTGEDNESKLRQRGRLAEAIAK